MHTKLLNVGKVTPVSDVIFKSTVNSLPHPINLEQTHDHGRLNKYNF